MLGRFRDELVLPYLDVLRHFSPLGICPRWAANGDGEHQPAARVAEDEPPRDARPRTV